MSAELRIVGFVCNWGAYSALDVAGTQQEGFPAAFTPVRLPCLSRLDAGLVLSAFEHGAEGVMLLACPPEKCNFHSGAAHAGRVFEESRQLMQLLGIEPARLALVEVPAGEGRFLANEIKEFACRVEGLTRPEKIGLKK